MDEALYTQLKEYNQKTRRRARIITSIILSVSLFGVYMGLLLYGANSISVLSKLDDKEKLLNKEIMRLKTENSKLQIKIFELHSLDPGN